MKAILSLGLLFAPLSIAGDLFNLKRQTTSTSATSTSSVFTVPTPSSVPTINSSTYDLSQHFCRIWRHQSVYADGKIYIDGGNTYVPQNNATFYNTPAGQYSQGMNDILLVLDLSKNFTNQDATVYKAVDKGPNVPNALIEGALWYSGITRKVYQLGGWFSFNSVSDPGYITDAQIPESAIWEFDIDGQIWAQSEFTLVNTGSKVDRSGAAANCDAPTLNQSFIFEGYVQRRSDHDYINYTVSSEFKFLEGMLQLDTNTSPPTLSNVSVPTYVGPRMNGAMIHVPVGDKGVIVQIGGQTTMSPTPYGIGIANANGGNVNINNSFVDIYDIETGYWFRQTTFGVPDIPTGRSDICTVLVSAEDGSSYNIYMIAGVETYNSVIAYEDMWVLTIPTFQWVKVHTRNGGIYGHTCHVVGENLIIIGGMQTTDTGGNVNVCSAHMPAEIFSLPLNNYTGIFDYDGASRTAPVPADVVSIVGGTATGGAVVTKPELWSDLYLQYVFNPTLTRPPYTPTYALANITAPVNTTTSTPSPAPKSPTNVGAIVGGVVAGVVVLAIAAILIWFCLKKRSEKKKAAARNVPELPSYQESKDTHPIEMPSPPLAFAPYRPYSPPVELASENHTPTADAEAQDEWRPLSTQAIERRPVGSPSRMSHQSAVSAGTDGTATGRLSRQSEVSATS